MTLAPRADESMKLSSSTDLESLKRWLEPRSIPSTSADDETPDLNTIETQGDQSGHGIEEGHDRSEWNCGEAACTSCSPRARANGGQERHVTKTYKEQRSRMKDEQTRGADQTPSRAAMPVSAKTDRDIENTEAYRRLGELVRPGYLIDPVFTTMRFRRRLGMTWVDQDVAKQLLLRQGGDGKDRSVSHQSQADQLDMTRQAFSKGVGHLRDLALCAVRPDLLYGERDHTYFHSLTPLIGAWQILWGEEDQNQRSIEQGNTTLATFCAEVRSRGWGWRLRKGNHGLTTVQPKIRGKRKCRSASVLWVIASPENIRDELIARIHH